jgi:hypothetical protein
MKEKAGCFAFFAGKCKLMFMSSLQLIEFDSIDIKYQIIFVVSWVRSLKITYLSVYFIRFLPVTTLPMHRLTKALMHLTLLAVC